jgi:RimJ/RimL family protein N-acetyltransferase
MLIEMRPARIADSEMLLEWRNDPETRAASKETDPISEAEHARWMKFNVLMGYPEHLVMIAETDLGSIGTVRFDAVKKDLMSYRVGIIIAPQHRGKRLAADVLARACGIMQDFNLLAEIRYKNAASIKTFEACDFLPINDDGEFLTYQRKPE